MAVTLGKPEPWAKVYHQIPCLLAQKIKTSDKKRGKPKMLGAQKQRPLKKRGKLKTQGARKQRP
jgi:hypothetical protein